MATYPLQIFFDGSCPLCKAKMEFYRSREHGSKLVFVDFTAPEFDPAPFAIPLVYRTFAGTRRHLPGSSPQKEVA